MKAARLLALFSKIATDVDAKRSATGGLEHRTAHKMPVVLLVDFIRGRTGNFALISGLLAPILLGLVGGAIDLYVYASHQTSLQNAADGAALASAREAALSGWSVERAQAVATAFVEANVSLSPGAGRSLTTLAKVDTTRRRVSVEIEQDHYGYFVMGYFRSSPQLRVTAVAAQTSGSNVCVIGLNSTEEATIGLNSNAILFAPDCAVYSNSGHTRGMLSLSNAVLTSSLSCSTGGFGGSPKNFSKKPLTDCPSINDPLVDRVGPPSSVPCNATNAAYDNYVGTLSPGIYCGGLVIKGNSDVKLQPGVYIIKGGQFLVDFELTGQRGRRRCLFHRNWQQLSFQKQCQCKLRGTEVWPPGWHNFLPGAGGGTYGFRY